MPFSTPMHLLITGICGFAGSAIARSLLQLSPRLLIHGVDNLSRPGSETNRLALRKLGIRIRHGDIRNASDLENLPDADWVLDAAANPSVLAGVDGRTSSRQLIEHNLSGTLNLLEFCKARGAGFVLLSTSRVYSIPALNFPVEVEDDAFKPAKTAGEICGLNDGGISEEFSTAPPLSLYGAAKLASEMLALEYSAAFELSVWINRCGVLGGAGQFGRADQGIFSFWINSYLRRRPLKYIGFGGGGFQVRDCLHPNDLARLLLRQIKTPEAGNRARVQNVSGGITNSISLRQLSQWCEKRFGHHEVRADATDRPFDVPWLVLDSARAREQWQWQPEIGLEQLLTEIADHALEHPDWLDLSEP